MGKCCSNGVVVSQLSPARNTRLTLSVKLAYWVAISDFPLACHFCLSLCVCVATSAAPRPCRPFWYIHSSWIATIGLGVFEPLSDFLYRAAGRPIFICLSACV